MLKVKCIQKFRAKNNIIIGYRIVDQNGNTKDVSSESLKQVIKQGTLEVTNLTLTSDNRLIDKTITQTSTKKIADIDNMLLKLKLLGCVTGIDKYCDHTIYLAKISEEDYRLFIPDDVTKITFNYAKPTPISEIPIESPNAKLTVYGGNNLKTAQGLFAGTEFKTIDLRKFNTNKVANMKYMFYECQVTSLDLSNFDTSKVKNMSHMFSECQATFIDLSSFDTSKVKNMQSMFSECKVTYLELFNFDTSNVTDMSDMFYYCKATSLDLSNFNTSKVKNMSHMFDGCKAIYIDLSNFDTGNVRDMGYMFSYCQVTSLDLSSFDTSNVTDMSMIFSACKATSINLGRNKDLKLQWDYRLK